MAAAKREFEKSRSTSKGSAFFSFSILTGCLNDVDACYPSDHPLPFPVIRSKARRGTRGEYPEIVIHFD